MPPVVGWTNLADTETQGGVVGENPIVTELELPFGLMSPARSVHAGGRILRQTAERGER